ncbi:hypothetical protein ACOZ4N_00080 (plasmid) [Halorientalis pallida]|uniref:hypothetical protein n=1 Tax=Halorientalis pallida TaxID=2479928 RepID=UPI003C6F8115
MSEKPFHEKVEEFNANKRDTHPFKEIPRWKRWAIGAILFATPIIQLLLMLNGQVVISVLAGIIGLGYLAGFTKPGRGFIHFAIENMDDDSSGISSTETKRVCPDCGWQNPQHNNYCNDCGEPLGRDE